MMPSFFWEGRPQGLFLHPVKKMTDDLVAQLVEHNTFNVGVLGSSPSGITKAQINYLGFFIDFVLAKKRVKL